MAGEIVIGSREHRDLFCRTFIESHVAYDPARIDWPVLDEPTLGRLRGLPFWGEAVETERQVARKVQALAPLESDPLIREAIAMNGYEEGRHAVLIQGLTGHYELPVKAAPSDPLPRDVTWGFIRTGYGECFDSFFAFGLIRLAGDSGFFPKALVELFEPIVQEEARHILFFVNWIAYRQARQPFPQRMLDRTWCAMAMASQVWRRVKTARGAATDDFMMKSPETFEVDLSPAGFLRLCLAENQRRLSRYDPRLLRPRFVPTLATLAARLLRG